MVGIWVKDETFDIRDGGGSWSTRWNRDECARSRKAVPKRMDERSLGTITSESTSGPNGNNFQEYLNVVTKEHVGKRLAQFKKSDGDKVVENSIDEKHLPVKGYLPNPPLSTFVKVIGIADTNKSIQAEIWNLFW
ncbi:hypothetical protein MTR67_031927 [Solanum verrucosum]|uniref:Uncharacterized protein n=1 Tax=Solanum verrucosum TaxID=315347 RepID=A0AAF0U3B5_SOLVR|nr:hypothetical protein MTR67_031927 [Solanum verrucosum]